MLQEFTFQSLEALIPHMRFPGAATPKLLLSICLFIRKPGFEFVVDSNNGVIVDFKNAL